MNRRKYQSILHCEREFSDMKSQCVQLQTTVNEMHHQITSGDLLQLRDRVLLKI